jgi:5-aminolevulinate synthase
MKKYKYKYSLTKSLENFKNEGFYRNFTPILRKVDSFPLTKLKFSDKNPDSDRKLKIWCTNDYLNMSHHEEVIEEMIHVIREVGTGSGGTRNISGTTPFHQNLEKSIASLHNRDSALVFTSAYSANQTTIWTICNAFKNICVFSDELNHASLIQGIKNSKGECKIFKHNNLDHLETLLKETDPSRPKLIVFESLYSMDGTITEIDKYVALAKKYNALTYLDEVHAVGIYGKNGQGVAESLGVAGDIDIINGTLAKAFGQIGGYIVADNYLIEYIRSFAPGFIFTTSIMPSVAAAAAKSISIVQKAHDKRDYIMKKADYLRTQLKLNKIPYINSNSHIVPVMAYKSQLAKLYSKNLLEKFQIYVQPIFYPTVPKNTARLRITITPKHSKSDIDELILALNDVFNVIKKEKSRKVFSETLKPAPLFL